MTTQVLCKSDHRFPCVSLPNGCPFSTPKDRVRGNLADSCRKHCLSLSLPTLRSMIRGVAHSNGYPCGSCATPPQECVNLCNSADYFGTQNGEECHCGYEGSSVYDRHGEASNCDVSCQGDSSEMCGGVFAISVYRLHEASVVGKKYRGVLPCVPMYRLSLQAIKLAEDNQSLQKSTSHGEDDLIMSRYVVRFLVLRGGDGHSVYGRSGRWQNLAPLPPTSRWSTRRVWPGSNALSAAILKRSLTS